MTVKKLAKEWLKHTGMKKGCYDSSEFYAFLLGEPSVMKAAHKAVKSMSPRKFVKWTARLTFGDGELPL